MQPLVGGTTPLDVWPGGTANLLAKELAVPGDLDRVADMIAASRTRRVSVGRAGSRYFLVMAGVGLDAALARAVNPRLKRLAGQGAFWFGQLVRWQPQPFVVEVDGNRYPATFTVLPNAPSYGGGLRIAPRASLDSACLDLCLFEWTDRLLYVRHLRAGMGGTHLGWPGVTYLQARCASASANSAVWVQVDGELLGALPMRFECVPAALSVVVP
jgi:diacylglycerol kinase family enzyme